MILGETPKQKREREQGRAERLQQAHQTGEFVDEFTTTISPENMKQAALDTLGRLPKCLTRDQNDKIKLRKDIQMEPEINQLVERQPTETLTETDIDLNAAERHLQTIQQFQKLVRTALKDGHDFGTIPGTPKPTLYKPGAEKIAKLLGLSDEYTLVEKVQDWDKPFFMYTVSCKLKSIRSGKLISEGIGHCNSMEGKYRWRESKRKCPNCGSEAIIKGKEQYGGGWLCWKKKGGCGAQYVDNDVRITGQETGKVPNEDIYSQVNTLLKMAKKRALVDASLSAGRLSELFTQDVEDMDNDTPSTNNRPPANNRSEIVTEFEEKYQTDKAEQPKETMPATTKESGRPMPTVFEMKHMTRIKELVLNEAKNQGQVGEERQELDNDEKNRLSNAIWNQLGHWPKNEEEVMLCARQIQVSDIFELIFPEDIDQ